MKSKPLDLDLRAKIIAQYLLSLSFGIKVFLTINYYKDSEFWQNLLKALNMKSHITNRYKIQKCFVRYREKIIQSYRELSAYVTDQKDISSTVIYSNIAQTPSVKYNLSVYQYREIFVSLN